MFMSKWMPLSPNKIKQVDCNWDFNFVSVVSVITTKYVDKITRVYMEVWM
jgi:hypothetical protein